MPQSLKLTAAIIWSCSIAFLTKCLWSAGRRNAYLDFSLAEIQAWEHLRSISFSAIFPHKVNHCCPLVPVLACFCRAYLMISHVSLLPLSDKHFQPFFARFSILRRWKHHWTSRKPFRTAGKLVTPNLIHHSSAPSLSQDRPAPSSPEPAPRRLGCWPSKLSRGEAYFKEKRDRYFLQVAPRRNDISTPRRALRNHGFWV